MTIKNKATRGGARKGSGAKPKYIGKTKTWSFRCPIVKLPEIKAIVKSKLAEWEL